MGRLRILGRILTLIIAMSFSTQAFPSLPVSSDLFIFTVDATVAGGSGVGAYQLGVPSNSNYQFYWEEVGNEASNNSVGLVHITDTNPILNFGSTGTYRIGIDPVGVPSGINAFTQFQADQGDAMATILSNLPTLAEVQAVIDAVNASEVALEALLASLSGGAPVTVDQLVAMTSV